LRRRFKPVETAGPKVPAYIVTFSDMVTLLLTFFVMLLSLADVQDPELFYLGRGSFVQSIREIGLGLLFGKRPHSDFGAVKIRYFISSPDKQFQGRTIDAKEEEIRRIFKQISQSMETMPSQIVAEKTNFSITNIRFDAGQAILNGAAKEFLTRFCLDLQQSAGSQGLKIYVLGLAGEQATEKQRWILSAKRAKVVADFLGDSLPAGTNWPVYSWGAGPGGEWVSQDSPISKQSQILIAVLRNQD